MKDKKMLKTILKDGLTNFMLAIMKIMAVVFIVYGSAEDKVIFIFAGFLVFEITPPLISSVVNSVKKAFAKGEKDE